MISRLEQDLLARPGRPFAAAPPEVGRAAVAVVLGPRSELLFIRRAERSGDPWSGHMAFPGGRLDPGDPSLRHAAERETSEEVGLDLAAAGRLLGSLDELPSPVRAGPTRLVISPYVYAVHRAPSLVLNHEVASVHWISLDRLAAGEGRGTFRLEWQDQVWQMPRVDLDGVRIWGLTLRMVDDLLLRLGADIGPGPRLLPRPG